MKAELSRTSHGRLAVSIARSQDPGSVNSQFFICFKSAPHLDRQYSIFGKVIEGMEYVDKIERGDEKQNGSVKNPDKIISFKTL